MSYPIDFSVTQLWRICLMGRDPNFGRWLFSETWSLDGFTGDPTPVQFPVTIYTRWDFPFGVHPHSPNLVSTAVIFERLNPGKRLKYQGRSWGVTTGPPLNPIAPEAACRLQRVGYAGGVYKYGRVAFPIFDDAWFTDLPHRRHIDAALWDNRLQTAMLFQPDVINLGPVTWRNVIFDRKNMELERVTNYQLLPCTTRYWQRWRPYLPDSAMIVADDKWYPTLEPWVPFP